jgi:GLPGLI family protein
MKNILITATCLLLLISSAFAQHARFPTSGTIEFEKRSNMFVMVQQFYGNRMEGLTQQLFDQYKKTQPQFKVAKSTLKFGDNKTLFTPAPVTDPPNNYFMIPPMSEQNNIVYSDLGTNISTSQKKLMGEVFLVTDTIRKIKWKITDETREIAGYTCRRANAVVMDSIYVVAFYTDKIPVSGGPESFTGLPGMILSLVLPNEHVRWDATKITDMAVPATEIVPQKKGKAVNNKSLQTTLEPAIKSAGPFAKPYLKALML